MHNRIETRKYIGKCITQQCRLKTVRRKKIYEKNDIIFRWDKIIQKNVTRHYFCLLRNLSKLEK
jgi:hypothetical protein